MVLAAATAGATLIPLNTSMLSVAMAPITSAFGVSLTTGAWLVLLYLTIMTSLQPVAGKMGDRYGHARIFLMGLLLFGGASAGAAVAPSFGWLVALRVLQGIAGSALAPNATALIRLVYPRERQGHALGLYVSVFSLGLTLGPVLSGLLISTLGWQAVFWINLPVVLFAVWTGYLALPRTTGGETQPFDWRGTTLFTLVVGGLVIALNLWKEGALPIPLPLALGVCALGGALLLYVEERVPDPLLRLSLFRLPGFGVGSASIFLIHTVFQAILLAVPYSLQQGRGFSAASAGMVLALFAGLQALVSPLAGRLSDQVGRRAVATAASLLFVSGALLLWRLPPAAPMGWYLAAMVLTGAGVGLASAPVQAASLAACPTHLVGVASGVWYSARYLGNITGTLLTSLLLPADGSSGALLYAALTGAAILLTGAVRFLPGGAQPARG